MSTVHVHPPLAQDILAGAVPARDRPYAPPASTFTTQERDRGTRPRRGPARKRCIAVRARQRVRKRRHGKNIHSSVYPLCARLHSWNAPPYARWSCASASCHIQSTPNAPSG
jgi:hypothetical protein